MNYIKSVFFDKRYPVTSALLILSTVLFILLQLLYLGNATSAQAILNFGGMYGRLVVEMPSQLWRLVSPIFLHIGWEHFLMNMISLYFIGRMVEQIFGSANYLALYLLSGVMGNAFTLFFTPNVVAAGASTSLFGLFGAVALLGTVVNNQYIQALGRNYFMLILFNIVFGLFNPSIGMAGHIGGLIGGVICAVIFPIKVEKGVFSIGKRISAVIVFVALLAFLLHPVIFNLFVG